MVGPVLLASCFVLPEVRTQHEDAVLDAIRDPSSVNPFRRRGGAARGIAGGEDKTVILHKLGKRKQTC